MCVTVPVGILITLINWPETKTFDINIKLVAYEIAPKIFSKKNHSSKKVILSNALPTEIWIRVRSKVESF